MPRLKSDLGEDYLDKLESLKEKSHDTIKKALYKGAGIVADEIRSSANKVLSSKATGQMMESFGIADIDVDARGIVNTKIGFDGYDKKGVANDLKANALESGTSTQRKRPFIRPAVSATKEKAVQVMGEIIDEEISKIMK